MGFGGQRRLAPRDPTVFGGITRGFSLHRVPAVGFVGGIPVGLEFFGDFGDLRVRVLRLRADLDCTGRSSPGRLERSTLSTFVFPFALSSLAALRSFPIIHTVRTVNKQKLPFACRARGKLYYLLVKKVSSKKPNRAAAELAGLRWASATPEDRAAVGRLGSLGGRARARKLTAQQRTDIARKAAAARWGKKTTGGESKGVPAEAGRSRPKSRPRGSSEEPSI